MKKLFLFFLGLIIFKSTESTAQWIGPYTGGFDASYVTDFNQRIASVGIGDYSGNNDGAKAALDICIPYLFLPRDYTNGNNLGEAIHSTVEKDYDHAWRMYTFDRHPGIEKFNILNPGTNLLSTYLIDDGSASIPLGRMLCEGSCEGSFSRT